MQSEKRKIKSTGFTLIEIMVAISIFAIVAVIATGALVTASDVNRKAQAIKIAMDNVAFAMDSMVLNLREGSEFGSFDDDRDFSAVDQKLGDRCNGCPRLVFKSQRPRPSGGDYLIVYSFNPTSGRIEFASTDATTDTPITSSEVNITDVRFYASGAAAVKPKVTIIVRGEVAGKTATEFNLQTTVKANF
ncbi:MAG: prepilin-type N-terminal cleavage/methylation domain-containing protein [Candidatus Vogelbacteria bacterium]|nr:prepilin-type N-terminal cleavage/methylation domain-containing protein [Candidatus Vogelbacteria bacterium]